MVRTRAWMLAVIWLPIAVGTFFILLSIFRRGWSIPRAMFEPGIPLIVLAVALIWLGSAVKRLKAREKTWITPIGAARVAAGALASSRGGALLGGYFTGHLALVLLHLENEAVAVHLWADVFSLACATFVMVAALWAESCCATSPGDGDQKPPHNSAAALA